MEFELLLIWLLVTFLYSHSRLSLANKNQQFGCNFSFVEPNSEKVHLISLWSKDGRAENPPNIVWSHLKSQFSVDISLNPHYPQYYMAAIDNARINLMSGIVFNENGCISKQAKQNRQFQMRSRFMDGSGPASIVKRNVAYVYSEAIYFWGSPYSQDWQHGVIDFLPLYSFALPFLLKNPHIPVIAGDYSRFFANKYPFNRTTFISRHIIHQTLAGGQISPFTPVKRLIYVDFLARDQSYVLPGTYNRILPFLTNTAVWTSSLINEFEAVLKASTNEYSDLENEIRNTHKLAGMMYPGKEGDFHTNTNSSEETNNNNKKIILYLDRSKLLNTSQLPAGQLTKVNGRSVLDQDELLEQIKQSLKPDFRLVVWTCLGYEQDQDLFRQASVIMGPHGGHFTNLIFASPGSHVIEFGRNLQLRQMHLSDYGVTNSRWVFKGMAECQGLKHWFIEDLNCIEEYKLHVKQKLEIVRNKNRTKTSQKKLNRSNIYPEQKLPVWSDANIRVSIKQVIDTLVAIGVSTKQKLNA